MLIFMLVILHVMVTTSSGFPHIYTPLKNTLIYMDNSFNLEKCYAKELTFDQ